MPNIQVTQDANPNNARSESSLVINPNDSLQVVAASKKFNNIQTYDFTLATEYSTDGGTSWHDSAAGDARLYRHDRSHHGVGRLG
jgi:hypothetical protein